VIEENEVLSAVLKAIGKGTFSDGDQDRFRPLLDDLYYHDYFMIASDFSSYAASQRDVGAAYRDYHRWFSSAILNTANTGWFSSDRAVRSYDREIWHSTPSLHFECVT
jgi:starch phosphorylase